MICVGMMTLFAACGGSGNDAGKNSSAGKSPSPTNPVPTDTATPTEAVTPTGEATPTKEPTAVPSETATPTPEPTPTEEPSPTPEPTAEPTSGPGEGETYRLEGIMYVIRDASIYTEPMESSRVLDDISVGEFIAINDGNGVFSDDDWYMVEYRNGKQGYLRREAVTDEIPAGCVRVGVKELTAVDWQTLSEAILEDYWNAHADVYNEKLVRAKIEDGEADIDAYRKKFRFEQGRDDRLYTTITYAPIARAELIINPNGEEENMAACGYDADGNLVYLQEFTREYDGAIPYDSCRIGTAKDGTRVKEYEFILHGSNRVLVFGEDDRPETVLTYRYTDNVFMTTPYCRLDMNYSGSRLNTVVMTIRGDELHEYNTFFEYANGYLVRMVEISRSQADDTWTVRSGYEMVPKADGE